MSLVPVNVTPQGDWAQDQHPQGVGLGPNSQRDHDIVARNDSNEARIFKFMSGSVTFLVFPQENYFPSCAYVFKGANAIIYLLR